MPSKSFIGSSAASIDALDGTRNVRKGRPLSRNVIRAVSVGMAGLAERQVRLAERQGELMAQAIRAILDELRLTPSSESWLPKSHVDT
jgi:hypothetical protein